MTAKERRLAYRKYHEDRQDYGEFCSLWSTELYRLSIANQVCSFTIKSFLLILQIMSSISVLIYVPSEISYPNVLSNKLSINRSCFILKLY